jgi:hypothetical protein
MIKIEFRKGEMEEFHYERFNRVVIGNGQSHEVFKDVGFGELGTMLGKQCLQGFFSTLLSMEAGCVRNRGTAFSRPLRGLKIVASLQ